MPNAIALLKNDHTTVRTLLGQLDAAATPRDRERLANRIADALEEHSAVEEEIFYPAYRAAAGTREDDEIYFKSREEHEVVGQVVDDLLHSDPRGASFAGRARVLRHLVEEHASEEERSLFPRAEQLLGEQRLRELGDEIERRKQSAGQEQQARPQGRRQEPPLRPRGEARDRGGECARSGSRFAIPFCGSIICRW